MPDNKNIVETFEIFDIAPMKERWAWAMVRSTRGPCGQRTARRISKGEFFGDKVEFYCAFSGAAAGGDMAANNPSVSPLIPSVK
jgi:hypothetical protein